MTRNRPHSHRAVITHCDQLTNILLVCNATDMQFCAERVTNWCSTVGVVDVNRSIDGTSREAILARSIRQRAQRAAMRGNGADEATVICFETVHATIEVSDQGERTFRGARRADAFDGTSCCFDEQRLCAKPRHNRGTMIETLGHDEPITRGEEPNHAVPKAHICRIGHLRDRGTNALDFAASLKIKHRGATVEGRVRQPSSIVRPRHGRRWTEVGGEYADDFARLC